MKTPHFINVLHSKIRETVKLQMRSPKWRALEKKTREAFPSCAACLSTKGLQVHHKQPFHLYPELELEPTNLIVLCMSPNECHLKLGHGDNFKCWNPNIATMAAAFQTLTDEERIKLQLTAKISRQVGA